MRRVIFASVGLGTRGGMANLADSTLMALDSLVAAGQLDRVDAISLLDQSKPQRSPTQGATSVYSGSKLRFVQGLRSAIRRGQPDFVLFDHTGVARATRVLPRSFRQVPFGVMVHGQVGLDPEARRDLLPVLRKAELIIANSPTTRRRVAQLVPERESAISVVYPPVSQRRIRAWATLSHSSLMERQPIVLIVSRLDATHPDKGHAVLLSAWQAVRSRVPGARLVVAGDGTDRSRLERLSVSLGVGDSVDFVGYVTGEQLGELFGRAVVFAMPSKREGFGIAYAEAMWNGLPCIGSTADAAGDVIVDHVTGFLVRYGDVEATAQAILTLLESRDLAGRLGSMARRHARQSFTPERHMHRLVEVLGLESTTVLSDGDGESLL